MKMFQKSVALLYMLKKYLKDKKEVMLGLPNFSNNVIQDSIEKGYLK